jgi:hypothetical protein
MGIQNPAAGVRSARQRIESGKSRCSAACLY